MTLVKICGLSQPEHVNAAVQAGAEFIGFVFAPSRRQVTIEAATKLAQDIPNTVKKVGVFVNAEQAFIEEAFEQVGLDYVQYHGDESPAFIKQVGLPAIKAFSITSTDDITKIAEYDVDYYLVDSPVAGSGQTFDWTLLQQLTVPREKLLLAGGLNKTNVQEAIRQVHPAGVDVSSGVETNKVKDSELIREFIDLAKGVHQHG